MTSLLTVEVPFYSGMDCVVDEQFTMTSLLTVESVNMRFGGVRALSDINLKVETGKITSLIGPNGAGKTTLFNVITGLLTPTSGRVYFKWLPKAACITTPLLLDPSSGWVYFKGWDITGFSVTRRSRLGIARTFQKLEAFNSLSARDNILVAAERRRRRDHQDHRHPADIADELLEMIGLEDVADITVGTLPTGTARLVELARALALTPTLLLLDEPSSGLNEEETQAVARLLERTVSDDLAVFLVEHDMSLVMDISHEIYVLDFGELIAHGSPEETQNDPKVRAAYLGGH